MHNLLLSLKVCVCVCGGDVPAVGRSLDALRLQLGGAPPDRGGSLCTPNLIRSYLVVNLLC